MSIRTHVFDEPSKVFASFAEAIREGAKLRPQTRVYLSDERGTCAVGAGLHAVFGSDFDDRGIFGFDAEIVYPYLLNSVVMCPAKKRWWERLFKIECSFSLIHRSLINTCGHLNDIHEWNRERVADWLETEEEKLGYVTVSDEGFGSTQRESGFPSQSVERLGQASEQRK